jgi:hypothetical protein
VADLLSRLATRAAGTAAPGTTPRLPSLFESGGVPAAAIAPDGPQQATAGDVPATPGAAPAAPRRPQGEPAPEEVRFGHAAPPVQVTVPAARPVGALPASASVVPSRVRAPARVAAVDPADPANPDHPPAAPTAAEAAPVRGEPISPSVQEHVPAVAVPADPTGTVRLPRAPAHPLLAADSPPPPAPDRDEPPPTVVTVSIGRIEVRALPSEVERPPAPRPSPREPARLGLHDYLRGVREPR